MKQESPNGFCARVVPAGKRLGAAGREMGNRLARWAMQAQKYGASTSVQVRRKLAECAAAAAPRASFEGLEGRTMLSAVTLTNGVLTLTGDQNATNSLTVDVGGNGTLWVNADGHIINPSAGSVQSINITGGDGTDWVYINPAVSTPATINTYGGNDHIQGGSGYDTISTGDGNDYVKASGNIVLGNGRNEVWVGAAGSYVKSGTGASLLVGGPGNDTLVGGNSADTLIGGAGSNQISYSTGSDSSSGSTGQNSGGSSNNSGGNTGNTGGNTGSTGSGTSPSAGSSSPSSSQVSNVWLSNGVLYLTGTTSQENSLTVDVGSNGTIWANANGHSINPSAGSVQSINISGGNGTDWVYINPAISTPAVINTYGGTDHIQGGSGYDTITAGDGNDNVKASGKIQLGNGNSQVWTGNAGSYVQAGNGNNLLVGGNGNDTLIAGSGYDTLIGGSGANVLTGGNNSSFPNAGPQDKITKGGTSSGTGSNPTPTPPPPPTQTPPPPSATPGQTVSGPEDATVYGSNHGDSVAPTPVIILTGTNGQAEHSVFVNALNSNLGAGTPLTATYQWNFGDPNSRFNVLPGWNAGHIYDNPGTYTITLTITNEAGHSSAVSTQVTITGSSRRTLYVDAWGGNDSNPGTSPNQPLRTWQRANQLFGDNTTVLFHRGEEFDFGDTFNFNNVNVTFGAYGSGANPVMMKVNGGGSGVFFMGSRTDQVVIENLTFDSIYKPSGTWADDINATGVYAGGRNITVRNNTFLNIEDAVDSFQSPTGLLIQDNSAPLMTGLRGYLDWMSGTDQVIIGNTVVNSTRQHVVRSSSTSTNRILIAGNNFAKPSDGAGGETPKTTINIRAGTYVDIADNTLTAGTLSIGPDSSLPVPTAVEWTKIDGNTIVNTQMLIHGSDHHMMISNNVIKDEIYPQIEINPIDPDYSARYMQDITVSHNTGILQGAIGTMVQVDGQAQWGTIKINNNLLAAPNMQPGNDFSSAVIIKAWDLSGEVFSHNVWAAPWAGWTGYAGGVNLISPYWDVRQYKTAQQWTSYSQVQDDQFRQVWVSDSNLQTSIDGQTAGAAVLVKLG